MRKSQWFPVCIYPHLMLLVLCVSMISFSLFSCARCLHASISISVLFFFRINLFYVFVYISHLAIVCVLFHSIFCVSPCMLLTISISLLRRPSSTILGFTSSCLCFCVSLCCLLIPCVLSCVCDDSVVYFSSTCVGQSSISVCLLTLSVSSTISVSMTVSPVVCSFLC